MYRISVLAQPQRGKGRKKSYRRPLLTGHPQVRIGKAVETAHVKEHLPQTQGDSGSPELHELLWGKGSTKMWVLNTRTSIILKFF